MHSKVQPVWAPELAQLSGLQHNHFLNIEQKIIDAFEAAVPSSSESQYTQETPHSHLQNSSGYQQKPRNERSEIFEAEELERMLDKSKGIVSSHKKAREPTDLIAKPVAEVSPHKAIKAEQFGSRFRTD